MTKDSIITLPHEHLRQRSKKVGFITPEIKQLCQYMIEASIDWENSRQHEIAVGLAAVQVDRLIKVVIVREDFQNHSNKKFQVFINPEILKYEGEIEEDHEGCLSVPTIYGLVPRHNKIRVKAQGLDGKEFRVRTEGFVARLLQHEVDHLNGKLFIDHIKDKPKAFFRLDPSGKELTPLDYEKEVRTNSILW